MARRLQTRAPPNSSQNHDATAFNPETIKKQLQQLYAVLEIQADFLECFSKLDGMALPLSETFIPARVRRRRAIVRAMVHYPCCRST
jgi:hypothetical protein